MAKECTKLIRSESNETRVDQKLSATQLQLEVKQKLTRTSDLDE